MKHINVIKFSALCLVALLFVSIAYYTSFQIESDNLEITFLDVGQGDCAYVKTPDNYRMLIDSGDKGSYEKYLKKFFGKRRINNIDAAVISHFHSDHFSGIYEMMEEKPIGRVYAPFTEEENPYSEIIEERCQYSGTDYNLIEFGNMIYDGEDGVKIFSLFPSESIYNGEDESGNNDALVIMLEYKNKRFLFMGDLEEDAEASLARLINLETDVLKVGHHGSKTSSSTELLSNAKPEYAVISCGAGNSYGFPDDKVLSRLKSSGIIVYRTDLNGDITFIVDEQGNISVTTSKQEE